MSFLLESLNLPAWIVQIRNTEQKYLSVLFQHERALKTDFKFLQCVVRTIQNFFQTSKFDTSRYMAIHVLNTL